MLTDKSKKIISTEISNLPKEMQEVINASNWENLSEEIGKKYLLDEDEIETLQLETASFLVGAIDEEEYPREIEDEIGTSKEEAEKISKEIFDKIFIPAGQALEENIKKNLRIKGSKWDQNLNFILSGGDYSSFLPPVREDVWNLASIDDKSNVSTDQSKGVTPLATPPIPRKPGTFATSKKMDDIKSKLVI